MAYSGNLHAYNEVVAGWNLMDHDVFLRYDVFMQSVVALVVHKRTKLVLIERNFHDVPNIRDEDVMYMAVISWLRKNLEDYRHWN